MTGGCVFAFSQLLAQDETLEVGAPCGVYIIVLVLAAPVLFKLKVRILLVVVILYFVPSAVELRPAMPGYCIGRCPSPRHRIIEFRHFINSFVQRYDVCQVGISCRPALYTTTHAVMMPLVVCQMFDELAIRKHRHFRTHETLTMVILVINHSVVNDVLCFGLILLVKVECIQRYTWYGSAGN